MHSCVCVCVCVCVFETRDGAGSWVSVNISTERAEICTRRVIRVSGGTAWNWARVEELCPVYHHFLYFLYFLLSLG